MPSLSQSLSRHHLLSLLFLGEQSRESGLLQHTVERIEGRHLWIQGQRWLDFLSMTYLPQGPPPPHDSASSASTSSTASSERGARAGWIAPAFCAAPVILDELQQLLAAWVGAEAALVFPSTSQAVHGVLSLWGEGTLLLSDEMTYEISKEAIAATCHRGATHQVFRHDDIDQLRALLEQGQDAMERVILCDGVLPGAGRPTALDQIAPLLETHQAFLLVDDAHGLGVFGRDPDDPHPNGQGGGGSFCYHDIWGPRVLYVASLSKAFGLPLAFLAGEHKAIQIIAKLSTHRQHSSLPGFSSLYEAHHILQAHHKHGATQRAQLQQHLRHFRTSLSDLPFSTQPTFPIQTLLLTPEDHDELAQYFSQRHLLCFVQPSPAEDEDAVALRFVFSAQHTKEDVQALIVLLQALFSEPRFRAMLRKEPHT